MYRKALFAMVMVCCLSAAAYAIPTIWLGNWKIKWEANQSIDLNTGNPIAVMIETPGGPPDDQFAGVDLLLTSGPDGVTPLSGPLIESIDLIGPGTLFYGNNVGQFDTVALPSLHAYSSTVTAAGSVNAGNGAGGPAVLAYLSFDATGLTPGTYPIYLKNLVIDAPNEFPTDVPPFLTPTLLDGSVTGRPLRDTDGGMYGTITVIPEPGSIVLALFGAGGLVAVAIRRRRKCGLRKR